MVSETCTTYKTYPLQYNRFSVMLANGQWKGESVHYKMRSVMRGLLTPSQMFDEV